MTDTAKLQVEAEALCQEWQRRLRLRDWDVKIVVSRSDEMRPNCSGTCSTILSNKTALVTLMHPIDHSERCLWPYDMEETLVHELLHMHFAPFQADEDTPADTAQEQAIDLIAHALVNLKRGL